MLMKRIVLATVCCRFRSWGLVKKLNFCSDFEHKVWSRFWSWSFVKVMKFNLGQDSEARFGLILKLTFYGEADVWFRFEVDAWSRFWWWNLIKICVICDMNSILGSVVPLAMFSQNNITQDAAGWQKLHGSTGGTRRKVLTCTKILSPNIRYFVAN